MADPPHNVAVIAYISMHGSTWRLVERLAEALGERGVGVELVHLAEADRGALAMALVDAATVVLAAPTVLGGAHPAAATAAFHLNMLRPKTRHLALVGSYGWSSLMREQLIEMVPDLDLDVLDPVIIQGRPRDGHLAELERLADAIARRHEPLGAPPLAAEAPPAEPPAADTPAPALAGDRAARYRCTKCGWIYDPAAGDPKRGIPPGTAFDAIDAERWFCPYCGAGKRRFRKR